MVKIGKADLRASLRDVIKSEMDKQQEADIKKTLEKNLEGSYSEYCKCGKIATINGKDEKTKVEEVKGKKYLVGNCQFCNTKYYVRIEMQPPASFFDKPEPVGIFYTEHDLFGTPEPEYKQIERPKLKVSTWKG